MSACTKADAIKFVQQQNADCDGDTWTDGYLGCVFDLAVKAIVRHNKESFQRTKPFTLKNGECIQSACDECSHGIISIVGNVNGSCDDVEIVDDNTDKEDDENDTWLASIYGACDPVSDGEYKIEKFEVIGDGGCEFKITPAVPDDGEEYRVNLVCLEYPEEGSEALCNHWDELMFLVMGISLMLEDDATTSAKADKWFNLYFKSIGLDREVDRDIFLQSIRYGVRE